MKRRTKKRLELLEAESTTHIASTIEEFKSMPIEEITQLTREQIEANGSPLEKDPTKAQMAWAYYRSLSIEAISPLEEYAMALLQSTQKGKFGIYNAAEITNQFAHAKHAQISTTDQNFAGLSKKFELTREDEIELYGACFAHTNLANILEELVHMKNNNELPDTQTLVRVLLKKLAEFYAAKHIETQFSRKYTVNTAQ